MADLESGEQETLERLRAHLHPDGQEKARESKTEGYVKVKLDDLADFLAAHPTAKIPKGEPMTCCKCGRPFQGGTFRVCYAAGWFCRHCYNLLALAPTGTRCIHCKQVIAIDDWRYKLWSVNLDVDGDLQRYFVHSGDCEKVLRQPSLQKAA